MRLESETKKKHDDFDASPKGKSRMLFLKVKLRTNNAFKTPVVAICLDTGQKVEVNSSAGNSHFIFLSRNPGWMEIHTVE